MESLERQFILVFVIILVPVLLRHKEFIWFFLLLLKCTNPVSPFLFFWAPGEKASFDRGTQPDTVDSIWHIVWLLINLNVAPTKLAVAWKWSSRKAQNDAGNVEAKALQSPEPPFDWGDGHRLHTHTHTWAHTLLFPLLLLVSFYHMFPPRSDVVVGGSGAEGAQALLSPLELTEQPPAFPLKPSAGGA